MKSEGQIKHKLAQVRFRHLKRELRNGLSRKSSNCQFNGTVDLPGRPCLGVCLYKAEDPAMWNGGTCDETLGDRAVHCALFECLNTKELIKDEFESFLEKADRARIAERYPDMAALLWALDIEKAEGLPELEDEEPLEAEPSLEIKVAVMKTASVKSVLSDVVVSPVVPEPDPEPAHESPDPPVVSEPDPAPSESSLQLISVYSPEDSSTELSAETPVARLGFAAFVLQLWVQLTRVFRRG